MGQRNHKSGKKNPLYVVKEDTVEPAHGLVEFFLKKLHLEPVVDILKSIITMLLEQVSTFPMLVAVQKIIDQIVAKLALFQRVSVI